MRVRSGSGIAFGRRLIETNDEPLKFPQLKRMPIQHLPSLSYGRLVVGALNRLDRDELVHMPNRIDAVLWHATFGLSPVSLIAGAALPAVCPEVNTTATNSAR
jgi:hypothetical protein